ncbi:Endoplasmic reticulum-Golgi intermediate compartment protein 2 [Smittium culicis]|uniref:Endoplasmic reticulum-Golgi intermediate compartment protein 2 n=1 Tax=Smittium culicis TaxID=133412 RepID=A0A1R1XZ95_9FUNG|nr:Endoplasmic reticulum-Golgi intermediate compartment protein 2 [Smittium culicis]
MQLLHTLKRLDMFSKVEESFESRSTSGGFISIVVYIAISIAFFAEFNEYLKYRERHEFSVDNSLDHKFDINFDIIVNTECHGLRMDIIDRSGDMNKVKSKIVKEKSEFKIKNEFSQPRKKLDGDQEHVHDIINLSKKIRKFTKGASRNSKGQSACRMYGTLTTNKIKGSFHITLINQGYMFSGPESSHNLTHIINEFSFGNFYPSLINPLDDTFQITENDSVAYQYYINVVPTIYKGFSISITLYLLGTNGKTLNTNQYSVNQNMIEADFFNHIPAGIFFTYDVEPILVKITEIKTPFSKFLIKMCSMIGGIFVTVGILFRIINYTSSRVVKPDSQNSSYSSILDKKNPTKADLVIPSNLYKD